MGGEKKSDATKRRIIEAYIGLMSEKPYDKIKITEISERAGIQRTTFYQYFDGSYELLLELEQQLLDGMKFYIPSPDRKPDDLSVYPCIEAWFEYCMNNRIALLALFSPNGDSYFEIMYKKKLCEAISRMMDDEGMPKDGLRKYCVELNYGIYTSLVKFAMQTGGMEGSMDAAALAALANNWRAAAIYTQKRCGLPVQSGDFEALFGKN